MNRTNHRPHCLAAAACGLALLGWGGVSTGGTKSAVSSGATGSLSSAITCSPLSASSSRTAGAAVSKPVSAGTTTIQTGGSSSAVTSSAPAEALTLSPYAEEVARILKFDRQVLLIIKEITRERIGRLVGYDAEGYQIIAPGVVVSVPEDRTEQVLAALRKRLVPLHYLPVVVDLNEGIKTDKIGVIRGTDQFEILRIMHTDGDETGITNQDVIDRLQAWDKLWPFDIIGADDGWVELEFKKLPDNLTSFAEEVYAFCPEAINQGPGSIEALARELRKTRRLNLWWE